MAKLSKVIPREFVDYYYKHSDPYKWTDEEIQTVKDMLSPCDPNSHTRGGYKYSILHFHLPYEIIKWCIDRGADVNVKHTYGTPLFKHAYDKSYETCVLLIEHGADVNAESYDGTTVLFHAADNGATSIVKLLLEHGADSSHRSNNINGNKTPLLYMLSRDRWGCGDIAEILVEDQKKHGGISEEDWSNARKYVLQMGYEWELKKSDKTRHDDDEKYRDDPELYEWIVACEQRNEESFKILYALFDVEPVKPIVKHDGKSPITVDPSLDYKQQFTKLWEYLVPVQGKCVSVQGEVIRISGRLNDEINGNGGANWDGHYKKMVLEMPKCLADGNSLEKTDLERVQGICNSILESGGYNCKEEINEIAEISVKWVSMNPDPIPLGDVPYKR